MKKIYLILVFLSFVYNGGADNYSLKNETKFVVKAVLKGSYFLEENNDLNHPSRDNIYYFLIDFNLINNTDDTVKFLTYSCSTFGNIVTDSKNIEICANNCASNSIMPVELGPKQILSVPVIFRTNTKNAVGSIKVGWILLSETTYNVSNLPKILARCRKSLENVIWSDSINLQGWGTRCYEIRTK